MYFILILITICAAHDFPDWPMWGGDLENTRDADRTDINSCNVRDATLEWMVKLDGDVVATPTVWDNHIYVPTYGRSLYKIKATNGEIVWGRNFSEYINSSTAYSRNSPAVNKHGILILGDQLSGTLVGVRASDGGKVWSTVLESHPAAIITTSATLEGDTAYVGISSREEAFAANPSYACCSFRGSAVAVDIKTGVVKWQTYFIPESLTGVGKYSGCSVWGSGPAVDRKQVCIGTANNYAVPEATRQCELCRLNNCSAIHPFNVSCVDPRVLFDSMICLNKRTGDINWAERTELYDAWNVGCQLPGFPNCPPPIGPDASFGQAPIINEDRVGAGQKNGIFWMRDRGNGKLIWSTRTGPGTARGGMMWGSAYDSKHNRIYVANSNGDYLPYKMINGQISTVGIWSALNARNGKLLWQTANPSNFNLPGPVTSAGNVVFGGSMNHTGPMYALDSRTGKILWTFISGGSVHSGPSISGNWFFWANGYTRLGGSPHTGLFAFKVKP